MIRLAAKALISLLACVLLSGCFTSERELIGYWQADRPLGEGVWAHWPNHPDGSEWDRESWRGAVELQRRRYVSDDENFPHHRARFMALAEDIYIVQWPREDGVAYGVAWAYEDNQTLSYHQPDCADLPEAARAELSLVPDGEGFCWVSDADQLQAVMRAYLDALAGEIRVDGVYRRVG